jgi:flagellin-specific chaperone FliS
MVSLDHETAPDIAANLHRLYAWCITELAQSTSDQDVDRIRSVRKVTQTLYEAWTEAIDQMC